MNARVHPSEFQVQMSVVGHMKLRARPGVFFASIPNGGYLADPRAIAKLKASGLRPGCPDLLIVAGGHAYGLEIKTHGGRQSPEQAAVEAAWTAAGGTYAVATGVDEALALLEAWGALRPDARAA